MWKLTVLSQPLAGFGGRQRETGRDTRGNKGDGRRWRGVGKGSRRGKRKKLLIHICISFFLSSHSEILLTNIQLTKSGWDLNMRNSEDKLATKVDQTVDDQDCITSRLRRMLVTRNCSLRTFLTQTTTQCNNATILIIILLSFFVPH